MPAVLRAFPAVDLRQRQQSLQAPGQACGAHAASAHAFIQLATQLLQLGWAHQVGGVHFAVVAGAKHPVAVHRVWLRIARIQSAGKAAFVTGFKVHPNLQPGVFFVLVVGSSFVGPAHRLRSALSQIGHHLGNRQRVLRVACLLMAAAT